MVQVNIVGFFHVFPVEKKYTMKALELLVDWETRE